MFHVYCLFVPAVSKIVVPAFFELLVHSNVELRIIELVRLQHRLLLGSMSMFCVFWFLFLFRLLSVFRILPYQEKEIWEAGTKTENVKFCSS